MDVIATQKSKFPCEDGGNHEFDQFDFDSGDGAEYGHCAKCGCWIDTDTGRNETRDAEIFEKTIDEES